MPVIGTAACSMSFYKSLINNFSFPLHVFFIESHFQLFFFIDVMDIQTVHLILFMFICILQQSIVSRTSIGLPVIHKYVHFPDLTPFEYPMHVFSFNRKGERWIYTLIYLHEFLKVFPFDLALFLSSHLSGNKARHAPSQSNSTANKGYP